MAEDKNGADIALETLLTALRDRKDREAMDAAKDLMVMIASGPVFPNVVRGVPLSDIQLGTIAIGVISMLKASETHKSPVPGLDVEGARFLTTLGQKLTSHIQSADDLAAVSRAMKLIGGFDPDKPL